MIFFFLIMLVPHVLLYSNRPMFSIAMAWGYGVGYIFLYIAFAYVLRMVFSILPQLAPKQRFALISLLPAGILFLVNAAKSQGGKRLRSLLLGCGFVLLTVAGPLHDVAQTGSHFC